MCIYQPSGCIVLIHVTERLSDLEFTTHRSMTLQGDLTCCQFVFLNNSHKIGCQIMSSLLVHLSLSSIAVAYQYPLITLAIYVWIMKP